jgi:hypothetical protein
MAIANGSFGLAVLRNSWNPSTGIRQQLFFQRVEWRCD